MRIGWLLFFLSSFTARAQQFQLAPPYIKFSSVFFDKSQLVEMKFEQPGTVIRYTLDGKEPNTQSNAYTEPVLINRHNQVLKAKVFGDGFLPSETVEERFVNQGLKILSCSSSSPNPKYPGNSSKILIDGQGGSPSFGDGSWLGFDCDSVSFLIQLSQKETVSSIMAHLMESQGSWIFLPQSVSVYSLENGTKAQVTLKPITINNKEQKASLAQLSFFEFTKPVQTQTLQLEMQVVRKMPEWHPAKGEHAWLFIDEIKVY